MSLGRTERLLAALGNPERTLPPVIHIAGTNGKGSTIAFMKAMCEAAGLVVHAYTSPHLVRFRERIAVAGAPIHDAALTELLEECETANAGAPITFFEITTTAAFLAFARAPAHIALIETGLGGRFDATNVIAKPALTAITPVSIDHTHFLGETVAEIAFEKAGILKSNTECVLGPQPDAAAAVIETRAMEVGAPLFRAGVDWRLDGSEWRDETMSLVLPTPALPGRHQLENAALAIACLRRLPAPRIDIVSASKGIAEAKWPARLQHLSDGPIAATLPEGWELWLDGGHNRAAADALAAAVANWRDAPLHLIVGMLDNRDPADFLRPLAALAASIRAIAIPGEENAYSAQALADRARDAGMEIAPEENLVGAIDAITRAGGASGRILVCGSLYLAGAVLEHDPAPI